LGQGIAAPGSFFQRLGAFRDLQIRWHSDEVQRLGALRLAEERRALDFVHDNEANPFGLATLCMLESAAGSDNRDFHRALAGAWKLFADGGLGYVARYECARCLSLAGELAEAAASFRQLYEETVNQGVLPSIDGDFREALQRRGASTEWSDLMRQTAKALLKQKQRPTIVTLAWQCRQVGDPALAENLLAIALADFSSDAERFFTSL